MPRFVALFTLIILVSLSVKGQTTAQIKKALETTPDPIGYVIKIKKKYKIDTVTVVSTASFMGIADSLAYKGKIGKVYGPFKGANVLVKILMKAPNTFYHVSHILIDTSLFRPRFADSLADALIAKIKAGSDFKSLATSYSSDHGSVVSGGDLGWFVRGIMLPEMDKQIAKRKKGEVFKVWSPAGLHVVKITDNPKQDNGFALMLRVLL